MTTLQTLLDEIDRMSDAALRVAQGVSEVRTPQHLVALRDSVRIKHKGELGRLFAALDDRFPSAGSHIGAFYGAAENALIEAVGGDELTPNDHRLLRDLWEAFLHAR